MTKQPENQRRSTFQFTVNGASHQGALYVTLSYDPAEIEDAIAKATRIAAKRSRDPAPTFVRIEKPRR